LKVTWDDSEGSESEQEESDNEMANICLMAKENEVSFSNIESNDELHSYEELQYAYDELCENTIKLYAKYITLKKKEMRFWNEIVTLKNEKENLLKDINNLTSKIRPSMALEEENTKLKETIKDLTKTLAKFVNGIENLDMLLGRQRCVFNKVWDMLLKINKNFIKISLLKNSADVCPMKKTIHKKNYKGSNPKVVNNWNTHKTWVSKQNNIPKANLHGPKKIWVPKRVT